MSNVQPIDLRKGQAVSLTKEFPGLEAVRIHLGWKVRTTSGTDFDLDSSILMSDANRKALGPEYFVYYRNLKSPEGSVVHVSGDNRKGGEEVIEATLNMVPTKCERISVIASIYDAAARRQSFGDVSDAYVRVVDMRNNSEILRHDLSEESSERTAIIVCELYRYKGEWKFRPVVQGYDSGLQGVIEDFGLVASFD